MAKSEDSIVIKKYANRRLYNTGTSTYVTLEDLAIMVKAEDDFVVIDAKSGEDITRSVLTQIIFEQEAKGQNLLPVAFLRNLIQFYGDSVQSIVPSYLEHSMDSFREQRESFQEQLGKGFDPSNAMDIMAEQTRKNTEVFQNAMRMFMPFALGEADETPPPSDADKPKDTDELEAMKAQLAEMQATIKSMSEK
ncbi:MAG: polyhydroxyalkanoate synthesis repressor PhaR [Hyphomicrobiales bacterium]